jgi:hypothetical protein
VPIVALSVQGDHLRTIGCVVRKREVPAIWPGEERIRRDANRAATMRRNAPATIAGLSEPTGDADPRDGYRCQTGVGHSYGLR